MPFTVKETPIKDLIIIEPKVFSDERGWFMESYKYSDFKSIGINVDFMQDNHSYSKKHVLRGLHYQLAPYAQGKLVRVVSGVVWDVAVDLRKDSPTYKKWVGVVLSDNNNYMFWIPEGFAHGFVALTDKVQFLYKTTNEYIKEVERAIRWDDPDIAVEWPVKKPIVSDKDKGNPLFSEIPEIDRLL